MLSDQLYVCASAANAIISQVGPPLRMSTDALQCVNQFLDEFLVLLLLQLNNTIETTRIKQACFRLLPNILGKNALLEADLQMKDHTDAYVFQHNIDTILPILRSRCIQQCTLSSSSSSSSPSPSSSIIIGSKKQPKEEEEQDENIPNWVIIYITAMMEHIGEHILTCVANSTEKTGYITIKDAFHALNQDAQLALLFSRMVLHDKIQKRVGISFINNRPRSCYLPQSRERYTTPKRNSVVEISFEDLDMEYYEQDENDINHHDNKRQANSTLEPIKYSTRKFKPPPRVQSVYAPDFQKTNFEDLIKSNSTVKVSLTPNRLKSIEDTTFEEKPESFITRSRRSTLASLKRIASTVKRPTSAPITKKKEESDTKRPFSTPPRTSSILSSSPRTSHMSIPSLSSKSHYSTSSLASTISNTSKELSIIGEEKKHMKELIQHESIAQILCERPSSIVARRAHRLGNSRPKSYHESQATQRYVMDKVIQFERIKKPTTDQAVQTDPIESDEEEWFIELDEQDEADIVHWLLGE